MLALDIFVQKNWQNLDLIDHASVSQKYGLQ